MSSPTSEQIPLTSSTLLGRILRPPLDELPFWIIQVSLLVIVSVHYLADVRPGFIGNSFPTGVPVAVLVIPIGYSALRYGLAGSTATMSWAIILWLPDLLLPHDQGHVSDDLLNLSIVLLVAIIFGRRIERERVDQSRALAVQAGYRRLFESNRSPILVLDNDDIISDANPAAFELFAPTIIGRSGHAILGDVDFNQPHGRVLTLANGHDYRLDSVAIALGAKDQRRQLNLEDVTEERSEERRSRQFARQIIEVEEAQRRQLARELHDEPLQLFLHLARRIETLSAVAGVPREVVNALEEARQQSLDAASRLRTVARDLRPPALDQLGLVAALSSLVAHLDADGELSAQLEVRGVARRLMPDVELGAFRIVQESCNNALRHANATHLNVIVAFSDDLLELTIVDDGKGFDVGASNPPGSVPSLGIIGMRERARLLGGTLSVHSTPGVGTVVQAILGLDASAQTL
ncbi:MAG: sensor histidine kinase [Acidimicrobiales bacterium]